jgi:Ca-activated chloride channel homolog
MFLKFAYPEFLYVALPAFFIVFLYKIRSSKLPFYVYPLAKKLSVAGCVKRSYHNQVLFFLRGLVLLTLTFLVARPQWIDEKSQVNIEGIDMAIALDVSGSMQLFDDLQDQRTRIDVAKNEAIRFIERRTNDPMSVVVFGRDALTLCPLTLDKKILKEIVGSLQLGIIDPNGTFLGTGLATAISRLRKSTAKGKVVILLTDGEPTPPEKIDPDVAIELAKEFDIKVYTVGIGNEHGGYINHPFGVQQAGVKLNTELLKKIANQTGGTFLKAGNPKELREAYNKIDLLEKTKHETDIFHNYYEAFLSFIWILLVLIGLEFIARLFVWRGI